MSRRVKLGARANGDVGLFVAPPGVDANTAPDAALVLNVTSKVSQLLLMGRTSSPTTVALGLSRSPFVFLTSQYDFSAIIGHTLGPGPVRPSPPFLAGAVGATAAINGNGASMSITLASTSSGGPYPAIYQVYSQAFN
jgi:hypothetical protein